jgi:hypothetical protein
MAVGDDSRCALRAIEHLSLHALGFLGPFETNNLVEQKFNTFLTCGISCLMIALNKLLLAALAGILHCG